MEDELLTKTEAAALLKSNAKAIEENVRAGNLTKVFVPFVGKRYRKSEVLALPGKLSAARASSRPVSTPVSTKEHGAGVTHDEVVLATPVTSSFEAARIANDWWARTGLDAMFRNYRLAQEPAIEWPALVASPYFGPELEGRDGILVKWDLRSKMTPAFVMGLLMKDTAAMRAELSRMFPNGAKEFAEMQRLGLVSDVDAVKALSG